MQTVVEINQLPTLDALNGTEEFPVDKNGVTYKVTVDQVSEVVSTGFIQNQTDEVQSASSLISGPHIVQHSSPDSAYILRGDDQSGPEPVIANIANLYSDVGGDSKMKSTLDIGRMDESDRVKIDGEDGILLKETLFPVTIDHVMTWNATSKAMRAMTKSDFVSDLNIQPTETSILGELFTDNFVRGSLGSDYTKIGSNATFATGSLLSVSGGTGTYTEYIRRNTYSTNLEDWVIESRFQTTQINVAGIAFGIQSVSQNSGYSLQVHLDTTTSSSSVIKFVYNNTTQLKHSNYGTMSVSLDDIIRVKITRSKNKIIAEFHNETSGVTLVSTYTYSYQDTSSILPNYGQFAIYAIGGTQAVESFTVTGTTAKSVDYLFVGDSITQGYETDYVNNRFASIFSQIAKKTVAVHAQPGNTVLDTLNDAEEIIALTPKRVVLMIGTNDVASTSLSDFQTRYTALVSDLDTIQQTILCLIPSNTTSIPNTTAFNSWIKSTYGNTHLIIDTNSPIVAGSTSSYIKSVHPSLQGHRLIASLIYSAVSDLIPVEPTNENTFGNYAIGGFEIPTAIFNKNPAVGKVCNLQAIVATSDTVLTVDQTTDFPVQGYAMLRNGSSRVFFKYSGKTSTTFSGVTQGIFNTTPQTISSISGWQITPIHFVMAPTEASTPSFLVTNSEDGQPIVIINGTQTYATDDMLTVGGTGQVNARIYSTNSNAAQFITKGATSNFGIIVYQDLQGGTVNTRFNAGTDTSNNYFIGRQGGSNNDIIVSPSNGNVGMGIAPGNKKLEVNGSFKATLPTSSAGLSTGDWWNDSGTVKIVP